MLVKVQRNGSCDESSDAYEMLSVFDDMEIHHENKMYVKRGYGEGSSDNENGTHGKIEITGNFTFVESDDGSFVLKRLSQDDLDDAAATFRAICGISEKEE